MVWVYESVRFDSGAEEWLDDVLNVQVVDAVHAAAEADISLKKQQNDLVIK